ncbi:DUF1636 family protein [Dongia sp.]|uniref:DUF1636 family protein n=1 Tax=Dongia sp. TaxID=1977262 RepID=UPI0035B43BB8
MTGIFDVGRNAPNLKSGNAAGRSAFELHVCVGCADPDPVRRRAKQGGGQALLAAILDAASRRHFAAMAEISAFECLGACTRRGRVSVSCRGKWSIIFGGLDDRQDAEPLCDFIEAWLRHPYGETAVKNRPPTIRKKIIGRTPPERHYLDCSGASPMKPNQIIRKVHITPQSIGENSDNEAQPS